MIKIVFKICKYNIINEIVETSIKNSQFLLIESS